MKSKITGISGIGPSTAKLLHEAGFDSVKSIANTVPGKLCQVSGFGMARAEQTILAAKQLLESAAATQELSASERNKPKKDKKSSKQKKPGRGKKTKKDKKDKKDKKGKKGKKEKKDKKGAKATVASTPTTTQE